MDPSQPSVTEYAVLGLLAEGPAHGFAIARQLEPDTPIGQVLTVRQPLVYRALGRLVEAGMAREARTEPGVAGGRRVVHRITAAGRQRLAAWLSEPVEHVRDLRIEFLLKLVLLRRAGESPLPLVERQRATLGATLAGLAGAADDPQDPVALWRKHSARAAAAFLGAIDDLHRRTGGVGAPGGHRPGGPGDEGR